MQLARHHDGEEVSFCAYCASCLLMGLLHPSAVSIVSLLALACEIIANDDGQNLCSWH